MSAGLSAAVALLATQPAPVLSRHHADGSHTVSHGPRCPRCHYMQGACLDAPRGQAA